jgi:hypothetical protein
VSDAKWGPRASATTISNTLPDVPNPANLSEIHGLALAEDRRDLYGLKLLAGPKEEPADLSARAADIIAIHGINGDAWKTWEDKRTGKLWLQDFLPKKLKGARIYSFGYASEVAFTRGRAKLKDFARSLLEGINSVRIEKVLFVLCIACRILLTRFSKPKIGQSSSYVIVWAALL